MNILRHAALIGVPLAFSVLLWFHPMIGDYEGLKDGPPPSAASR
jgi:hypothetical protein